MTDALTTAIDTALHDLGTDGYAGVAETEGWESVSPYVDDGALKPAPLAPLKADKQSQTEGCAKRDGSPMQRWMSLSSTARPARFEGGKR